MSNWIEHELGIMEESQGSFSPDILPDEAIVYSRQWWRREDNGTFTVVTYSAAPSKDEARYGIDGDEVRNVPPFQVEDMLEWIVCYDKDDPGSTEINTEIEYGDMDYAAFDSIDEANAYARRKVRNLDVNRDISIPHPV